MGPAGADGGDAARESADLHGGGPHRVGSVAELLVVVGSPALGGAADDGAGVESKCVDGGDATSKSGDIDREVAVGGQAVTELTVIAVAPALGGAADDRARVPRAGGDGGDATRQAGDLHGGVDTFGGICVVGEGDSVAELTIDVPSPALGGAADDGTRVLATGTDGGDTAGEAGDLHRSGGVGVAAVAELAVVVPSPALGGAADDGARMLASCADGRDAAGEAGDLHRSVDAAGRRIDGRSVTDLAVVVVSPALGGTIDDRAGVEFAAGDQRLEGAGRILVGVGRDEVGANGQRRRPHRKGGETPNDPETGARAALGPGACIADHGESFRLSRKATRAICSRSDPSDMTFRYETGQPPRAPWRAGRSSSP